MSYTPTTEEVRDVYKSRLIKVGDNRFELIDEIEANAEFDRWLAEVKAEAWDEGWCRCFDSDGYKTDNPYRRGETE